MLDDRDRRGRTGCRLVARTASGASRVGSHVDDALRCAGGCDVYPDRYDTGPARGSDPRGLPGCRDRGRLPALALAGCCLRPAGGARVPCQGLCVSVLPGALRRGVGLPAAAKTLEWGGGATTGGSHRDGLACLRAARGQLGGPPEPQICPNHDRHHGVLSVQPLQRGWRRSLPGRWAVSTFQRHCDHRLGRPHRLAHTRPRGTKQNAIEASSESGRQVLLQRGSQSTSPARPGRSPSIREATPGRLGPLARVPGPLLAQPRAAALDPWPILFCIAVHSARFAGVVSVRAAWPHA